jgi:hypothetical protein
MALQGWQEPLQQLLALSGLLQMLAGAAWKLAVPSQRQAAVMLVVGVLLQLVLMLVGQL